MPRLYFGTAELHHQKYRSCISSSCFRRRVSLAQDDFRTLYLPKDDDVVMEVRRMFRTSGWEEPYAKGQPKVGREPNDQNCLPANGLEDTA